MSGAVALLGVGTMALFASSCRKEADATPPQATPSITLSREKVPLGAPVDITYKFIVAPEAAFAQNYRVMVHVVDPNEELMWTDDHDPPVPTSSWKPGQTVEYTRTVFVPVYPYVGDASIQVGLYGEANQPRVLLHGEDAGQRAYKVGRVQLAPQSESVFTIFKDGWHSPENAEHNAAVEWHWTKKVATLAVRNPKKDSVLYLELDNPGGVFEETQQVTVSTGSGAALDEFMLTTKRMVLRKIALPAATLGADDNVDIKITVDKTFVPSHLSSTSKDPRELGVRVFHAVVVSSVP